MNIIRTMGSLAKRLRTGVYRDPVRDWLVLITISTIALTGIIIWNAWTFDVVASGGVIGAPVTEVPPLFSRSSLDAVHTIFSSRAAEQAKYVTGTYRYADPSQ